MGTPILKKDNFSDEATLIAFHLHSEDADFLSQMFSNCSIERRWATEIKKPKRSLSKILI